LQRLANDVNRAAVKSACVALEMSGIHPSICVNPREALRGLFGVPGRGCTGWMRDSVLRQHDSVLVWCFVQD